LPEFRLLVDEKIAAICGNLRQFAAICGNLRQFAG
jgi:hypothetical protein